MRPGRFVRLVWAEPGAAPALTGATCSSPSASASPSTRRASSPSRRAPSLRGPRAPDAAGARALALRPRRRRCRSSTSTSASTPARTSRRCACKAVRASTAVARCRQRRLLSPRARRRGRRLAGDRAARRASATCASCPTSAPPSLDGVGARLVVHASLASIVFAAAGRAAVSPARRLARRARRRVAGQRRRAAARQRAGALRSRARSARSRSTKRPRAPPSRRRARRACDRGCSGRADRRRRRPGALVWRLARSGRRSRARRAADASISLAPSAATERDAARALQAPRNSPTGLSSSTRSQTALTTIRIGVPRMQADGAPQPAEGEHADEHRERAHPAGAAGPPRRQQVADDGVDRRTSWRRSAAALSMLSNCMKPTIAEPTPTITRADVGNEVGDAGERRPRPPRC